MAAKTIKEFVEERIEEILKDHRGDRASFDEISPDYWDIAKRYALMLAQDELDGNGDVDFGYLDNLLVNFLVGYEAGKGFPIIGMQEERREDEH